MTNQWTKCEDERPAKEAYYWVTVEYDGVRYVQYHLWIVDVFGRKDAYWGGIGPGGKAIAWMDALKPSPYVDVFEQAKPIQT